MSETRIENLCSRILVALAEKNGGRLSIDADVFDRFSKPEKFIVISVEKNEKTRQVEITIRDAKDRG